MLFCQIADLLVDLAVLGVVIKVMILLTAKPLQQNLPSVVVGQPPSQALSPVASSPTSFPRGLFQIVKRHPDGSVERVGERLAGHPDLRKAFLDEPSLGIRWPDGTVRWAKPQKEQED